MANGNKSKVKGNGFERDVCKYLHGVTGLKFLRVPSSGGYIGGKNINRASDMDDNQVRIMDGDIIVPEEWADWSLECKFYKDIAWKKIYQPEGVAQLNGWIEQAKITSKPYWMLFFKINNAGQYCVIKKTVVGKFDFQLPECYSVYMNEYIIMDMKLFIEENYRRMINEDFRNK